MPILCSKSPKMGVPEGKSAQKPHFCAQKARKRGFQTPKKHKNPDFVLEKPENRGSRPKKSTKNPILCSGREEIGIGKHNLREAYRKRGLPANHRARQCTLELPGRRIRVRYELQERHTQPSCSRIRHPTPAHRPSDSLITHPAAAHRPGGSLIRRRCGGGVGNRCRWAERFALSEQRPYVAAMGIDAYMLIDTAKERMPQLRVSKSGPGVPDC